MLGFYSTTQDPIVGIALVGDAVLGGGTVKYPLEHYSDYHITHKGDGNDELFFSLPTNDSMYPLIREEAQVIANGNIWTVKKIYDGDITCELDLDFLKEEVMIAYSSGSVRLSALLASLLPEEWTVSGATDSTIKRTIEYDFATAYDVIQRALTVYSCSYVWDIPNTTLYVTFPDLIETSGEYITDELNLRKLSYQGDSTEFCTRLYPFGSDAMTIEDAVVDGETYGKTYVENFDYSDKIVAAYWTDERYTDPTALYEDAVARLAVMAQPAKSYECDAIDLAKLDDDYSFLEFVMHKKITLIDRQRNLRVVHEVVEYDEYPEEPTRSVVTLSTVAPTVSSKISKVESRIYDYTDNYKHEFELTALTLRNLIETLDGNYSTIQQTVDSISSTVSAQGTTITELVDSTGEILTAVTTNTSNIETLTDTLNDEIEERTTYIRFIATEPAIVLGTGDSEEIKLKLNNGIIYFYNGQDTDTTSDVDPFASFSSEQSMSERFLAKKSIQIGSEDDTYKLLIKKLTTGDVIIDQI